MIAAGLTSSPGFTATSAFGTRTLFSSPRMWTTSRPSSVRLTSVTTPPISAISPSGLFSVLRASNSSSARGSPWVMSSPTTPPVWNVRMVSWVPGSPMLWAAITPTAVPSSTGRWVLRSSP